MVLSRLPIGQLNKPLWNNDNCDVVNTQLEGEIDLNGPIVFKPLVVE